MGFNVEKKRRIVLKIQKFKKYTDKKFKKDLIDYINNDVFSSHVIKKTIKTIISQILWLCDIYFDNISSNIESLLKNIGSVSEFECIFADNNIFYIENFISYTILNFKKHLKTSI